MVIFRRRRFLVVKVDRWDGALSFIKKQLGQFRHKASISGRIYALYVLEHILPYSFTQKQAGPFLPLCIVLWNIYAYCLEYLCVIILARQSWLLSLLTETYCSVYAPPISQTSSENIWFITRSHDQVSPCSAKTTRFLITAGSLENPFLCNRFYVQPIKSKAI